MRKSSEMKKEELIGGIAASRRAILDAAGSFSADKADKIFLGVWSLKDLLAHLIGWDVTNTEAIEEILAGKYPAFSRFYDKDWKSFNQGLVQHYKKAALDELLVDVQASHRQFLCFLERLPAEALLNGKARSERGRTMSIAGLLRAEAADELQHAAQITAFFGGSSE